MVVYEFQDCMRHLTVCLCDIYVKADVLFTVGMCRSMFKKTTTTDYSHVLYKGTWGAEKG